MRLLKLWEIPIRGGMLDLSGKLLRRWHLEFDIPIAGLGIPVFNFFYSQDIDRGDLLWIVRSSTGTAGVGLYRVPLNDKVPIIPEKFVEDDKGNWNPDPLYAYVKPFAMLPDEMRHRMCGTSQLRPLPMEGRIVVLMEHHGCPGQIVFFDLITNEWSEVHLMETKVDLKKPKDK